jgi:thioredoxin-related protein
MIRSLIAFFFLFITVDTNWINNLDDAKVTAKKEHKLILLNFSGSDWCLPCIKLRKDIFDTEAFNSYAADNLVLVNADFPRKNKNQLSKEQQKINETLADRYDPKGNFPYTILLDANGNKLKIWDGFYKDGIENFITEIKEASRVNQ